MLNQPLFSIPLAQMHATTSSSAAPPVAAPVADSPATTTTGTAATTGASGTQPAPDAGHASGAGSMIQFALIAVVFVGFYLIMMRGQKKTEKNRKQMIQAMKKGDEVMTIGGMVARVVSIDDDEVVLKIDESANVKARYKKSAIQQVLTAEDKAK
ncbi:MAG: preprotein translocase subunit YajC [Phycisphaerae bacterium]